MQKRGLTTMDLTRIAILGALASILFMIEFPVFPAVPFYKLDFSNVPVVLGGFAMGPLPGLLILAMKDLIGLTHSSTGGIGELADLLAGAAFILPGAIIYRRLKSRKNALLGMLAGIILMIVASVLANMYILIPAFMPYETVVAMGQKMIPSIQNIWQFLFSVTALFNLIKGIAICLVTYVLYKPLSPFLHAKKR